MVLHFLFLDVLDHRQCIAWNYWKSHQILSYMLNPQSIAVQRKSFINTRPTPGLAHCEDCFSR